jgi:beta-lactamase class A
MSLDDALAANPHLLEMTRKPQPTFDDDPRDTTTPDSMVLLLAKIAQDQALSPGSTEVIMSAMKRDTTGLNRLRAMLPPEVVVADKTGTIGGTVNDVGIIELPGSRGRVAIAVYVKKIGSDQREKVIAQIARCVYDYMLVEAASR